MKIRKLLYCSEVLSKDHLQILRILLFQLNLSIIMNEEKGTPIRNCKNLCKYKDEKNPKKRLSKYL